MSQIMSEFHVAKSNCYIRLALSIIFQENKKISQISTFTCENFIVTPVIKQAHKLNQVQ